MCGNYSITASGAVDNDYTIGYAAGTLGVTPAAPDDHGGQPDEGLWGGVADVDGQLRGPGQRRHAGQPDHAADARLPRPRQRAMLAAIRSPPVGAADNDYTIAYAAAARSALHQLPSPSPRTTRRRRRGTANPAPRLLPAVSSMATRLPV